MESVYCTFHSSSFNLNCSVATALSVRHGNTGIDELYPPCGMPTTHLLPSPLHPQSFPYSTEFCFLVPTVYVRPVHLLEFSVSMARHRRIRLSVLLADLYILYLEMLFRYLKIIYSPTLCFYPILSVYLSCALPFPSLLCLLALFPPLTLSTLPRARPFCFYHPPPHVYTTTYHLTLLCLSIVTSLKVPVLLKQRPELDIQRDLISRPSGNARTPG